MKNSIHNKINKRSRKQYIKNLPKHTRGMIKAMSFFIYDRATDKNKDYLYYEWHNKIGLPVYY